MTEIHAADYIRKLRMLEERIGATTKYQILSPFRCNPNDVINLQDAAKRIADFVGLSDLTFIVAVAKQKEKIGGHVELERGQQEVFIEISLDIRGSTASTLAVLAHEISHKVLQRHGISLGRGLVRNYENEILTDINAIFLGLGKLMLNGAKVQAETQRGGQRVIRKMRTGYLSAQQLAFVYRLVCAMRRVTEREMMSGLSSQAVSAIRSCDPHEAQYFDPRFQQQEHREQLLRDLRSEAHSLEEKMGRLREQVGLVKRDVIDATERFLSDIEAELGKLREPTRALSAAEIHEPCYRFLDTVDLNTEVREHHAKLLEAAKRAGEVMNRLRSLADPIGTEPRKPRDESIFGRFFGRSRRIS